MRTLLLATSLTLLSLAPSLHADVSLPAILSDNMLLQADKPATLWGTAAPNEKITISFDSQSVSTTADAAGSWKTALKPLKSGTAGNLTITANNSLTIKNILVGSLWLCSGQSNMEFALNAAHDFKTEAEKTNFPKIRLFKVDHAVAFTPQTNLVGKWVECTPASARSFSAVAFFFGRDLHLATNQPIGLIQSCWGGTSAQAWTSLDALSQPPAFTTYVEAHRKIAANIDALVADYDKQLPLILAARKKWQTEVYAPYQAELDAWKKASDAAAAANQPLPPKPKIASPEPKITTRPDKHPGTPTVLYNGMIAPLTNLSLQGVIWYQGESNAGAHAQYATLFPRLITDWRTHFNQPELPFLFVQLASYLPTVDSPTDPDWARLRESQLTTLKLPNTAMAVAIDVGDPANIHPRNKSSVGSRLALAALKLVYKKDVIPSGPLYSTMKIEGNKIRLTFTDVGTGLVIGTPPPTSLDAPPAKPAPELQGFAIAGEDKKFVWAKATIEPDNTILVSADSIPAPVAVRYAWANSPTANLYNKQLLPASPFRTDPWPQSPP